MSEHLSTDGPSRSPRWLLLLHQLPKTAAKGRVRIWRRLQQLGAVAVRGSAYVLPYSPQALEDFEWLRAEIVGLGGTAGVFEGHPVGATLEAEMMEQFVERATADYRRLQEAIRAAARRTAHSGAARDVTLVRDTQALRKRLAQLESLHAVAHPLRAEAAAELEALERRVVGPAAAKTTARPGASADQMFTSRVWVTRPRPGVDRMASAWLIRTFIDPQAQFVFADSPAADQIAFDMFEGDFTHQGDACTFEVLVRRFRIADPAVRRIGEVVHDLDLNDGRFDRPECPTIGLLVQGAQDAHPIDRQALDAGIAIFGALHAAFGAEASPGAAPRSKSRGRIRRRAARKASR